MQARDNFERALMVLAGVVGLAGVNGCGVGALQPSASASVQGVAFSGKVFGGLQPVAFSTLQIYQVGTGGYGSAATPLLNKAVSTDANGNYSVSGDYTCPSASTLVYLAAVGGNPGLASGTNNTALAEIALLGQCGNLNSNTFVTINELSTVAAVYALQPFISSIGAIGAPSTNLQGLTSGFATAMSLVSLPGGTPGNAPAIATVPTATIISLADAMASCVNSTGSLSSNQPCGRLFTAATPTNANAPTDIVLALINIARNPSLNVRAIFNTIASNPPYQTGLSTAPADWTLAINYVAPAFSGPSDLAVDGQGAVWVAALPGTGGPGSTTISSLTTSGLGGSFVQTAKSYANMAIDVSGNIWLSNTNYSNVVEMTQAGVLNGPFNGGGISGPGPMAFDPAGDLWILNNTTTVSELNATGGGMSPAGGLNTTTASGPVAIAIDATGHVWMSDSAGNEVAKLTNQGQLVAGSPYTNGGLSSPFALAIDSQNEAFVANRTSSTLTKFAATGTPPVTTGYSGDGMVVPIAMTLDGGNTAWVVNAGASTISALPATSTGQTGYGSAYLTNPYKIAVDGAGNVWVANVGTSVAGSGVITQIVGAAQPVVTPLSEAVKSARIAQKP